MRRVRVTVAMTLAALATLAPLLAAAEPLCPSARSPAQARRLAGQAFAQAEALFDAGDLRAAIDLFECSYALVAHPATLFNIARAAEELGDRALAVVTYRSYLDRFADAGRREEVEARLGDLEAEPAEPEPAEPAEPEPAEPAEPEPAAEEASPEETLPQGPGPGPAPRPEDAERAGVAADREPPRDERRDQPRPPARMSAARLAAWVLLPLALSVGAAGGGLYGGAVIQNQDYRDAEARGAPQEVLDDLVASGRAFEQAAWGLVGLGAALLATSIVLFLAADAEAPVAGASGRSARLAPLLGPGRLGLAFGF